MSLCLESILKEQAIFRAQQLELIYSQSGILQKILPDAPRSKVDIAKSKPGPHAMVSLDR
jgi:hypothetical protein